MRDDDNLNQAVPNEFPVRVILTLACPSHKIKREVCA